MTAVVAINTTSRSASSSAAQSSRSTNKTISPNSRKKSTSVSSLAGPATATSSTTGTPLLSPLAINTANVSSSRRPSKSSSARRIVIPTAAEYVDDDQLATPSPCPPTPSARMSTGSGIYESDFAGGDTARWSSAVSVAGNLKLVDVIEGPSHAMSIRYSRDGNTIAAGFAEGTIKLYDAQTSQCVSTLHDDVTIAAGQPVTCLRYGPANRILLATYASGVVKFWAPESLCCSLSLDEQRHTLAAAFNPPADKFLTTGSTPEIHQYDVKTGTRIMTLEAREHRAIMDGHRARVFAVQYHPSMLNVFLTGGWDNTVQYWDDRQQHAVRKFYGPHICGDALDIDAERGLILTGSWRTDFPLQVWDFASATKIRDIPCDKLLGNSSLYCAQWLGRDQLFCGGSDRNMARTITRSSLVTYGHVTGLASGVYSADSTSRVEALNASTNSSSYNNNNNNSNSKSTSRLALASGPYVYVIRYAASASHLSPPSAASSSAAQSASSNSTSAGSP